MLSLRRNLFFFLIVLCLIVIFQNTGVVKVRLIFWNLELSKALLFFLLLLFGFISGWLGHLVHLRKRR